MKSKKLLILIASLAALVVFIVIMVAVFSAGSVVVVYHDFSGARIATPDSGGIAPNDVFTFVQGKSTVFLSKTKLLDQVNTTFTDWHAYEIRKHFPNIIEVHVVQCTAMLKIDVGGQEVYIDCFGYVMNEPASGRVIDVSSAFNGTDAKSQRVGQKFEFAASENNPRLEYVLDALLATWQCYIETPDLAALLGDDNVFHFDDDGNMLITPRSGGTIRILSPGTVVSEEATLRQRIIDAYGVYYNKYADMQGDEWVITVRDDGTITSPDPS